MQAQLNEAEANAVRMDRLVQEKLVSTSQHDQASRSATPCARNSRPRAVHKSAQSQLRIADQDVDNTVVRAPFAGVVIAKAAQPGEIVSPLSAGGGFTRTGIGTIVDMDSLEVEVEVGEAFIGRVQPKMPVEGHAQCLPGLEDPGRGDRNHSRRRPRQGHIKVRIALKVKDPRIVPEMGVQVSFLEPPVLPRQSPRRPVCSRPPRRSPRAMARMSPSSSPTRKSHNARSGSVQTLGDDREVLDGLAGGDTVVLDPPKDLADGERVRIAAATDDAAAGDCRPDPPLIEV